MASESYFTYATSTAGFSLQSHSSEESFKGPPRVDSKEGNVQAKKAIACGQLGSMKKLCSFGNRGSTR